MFGYLTTAFGLTVYCCLAPIMLISLVISPVLMRVTKPKVEVKSGRKTQTETKDRNLISATIAFTRFFFVSMIVMATLSIAGWYGFLLVTGTENVLDFAAQNAPIPVERETLEDIIEPAATIEAERDSDGT